MVGADHFGCLLRCSADRAQAPDDRGCRRVNCGRRAARRSFRAGLAFRIRPSGTYEDMFDR